MKLKLTKPRYKLNLKELKREKSFIQGQNYWRAIRRRIPFFMDGYRYAAAAVKRRWGIKFCFFEAGRGVMPVYLPGYLNQRGADVWWGKMNQDKRFAMNLVREVRGCVDVEKRLARSIPQRELTSKEVIRALVDHLAWWTKFFETAYLWFGVENIKEKIDKEIKKAWKSSEKDLIRFLDAAYRPMKFPLSSIEQRDLLKLVLLKGRKLKTALERHQKKYRHLSLHNIDDECFNLDYYEGRLKLLRKSLEYKKQKKLLEIADREVAEAGRLIKKAKLPAWVKERINFVRWFMYIRTETVDHFMLVNGAYKSVFASISQILSIPVEAALHMTYEELITSLKRGKLSVPGKMLLDRTNKGYAYLIAPRGSYLVTGKEAEWLHKFVIPQKTVEKIAKLTGQPAFPGKVSGKARIILDRRNAHKLKKGEILVTTMTSPEFVPAMKIAAGIITNEGGILCHAAIMSRELRKPCVIGTKIATDVIKAGQMITLDADNGIVVLE